MDDSSLKTWVALKAPVGFYNNCLNCINSHGGSAVCTYTNSCTAPHRDYYNMTGPSMYEWDGKYIWKLTQIE